MTDSIIVRVTRDHYDLAHPAEQQTQVYVQIPEVARASWLLPAGRYEELRDAEWGEVLDAAHAHYERQFVVSDSVSAASRAAVRDWLAVDENRDTLTTAWYLEQARQHPVARKLLTENGRLLAELGQRILDLADVTADRNQLRAKLAPRTAEAPVPRAERSYWAAIADALNAACAAGMPVGIDLDGTLTDHRAWSVVWDRAAERWTVTGYDDDATDAITRRIAPTQVLHTSDPDTPEDSPATLLAQRLRSTQPDVDATEVLDARTLRVTITPRSLDCWRWWQARLNVDITTVTCRGPVTTATGRHDGVTVYIAAQGVAALAAAAKERDGQ